MVTWNEVTFAIADEDRSKISWIGKARPTSIPGSLGVGAAAATGAPTAVVAVVGAAMAGCAVLGATVAGIGIAVGIEVGDDAATSALVGSSFASVREHATLNAAITPSKLNINNRFK